MRKFFVLTIVFSLAAAVPCVAQGTGRTCDPTGTWVGGADPQIPSYQLTVARLDLGRYSTEFQQLYQLSPPEMGSPWGTTWRGELRKDGQRYEHYSFANFQITPQVAEMYAGEPFNLALAPEDLAKPELDAIWGHVTMLDCNTLQSEIEWYGAYVPFTVDRIPFATPPEFDALALFFGGASLIETYHRVGPDCPLCAVPRAVAGAAHASPGSDVRSMVRKKPGKKK